jgi:hypothetical protein
MKRSDLATKTVDEQWAAIHTQVMESAMTIRGSWKLHEMYDLCRARFYANADTYQGSLFTKTSAELQQDALEELADYHIYKATQALPE